MAKRGRKPSERKGYFYEKEEDAIVSYINEENEIERNGGKICGTGKSQP